MYIVCFGQIRPLFLPSSSSLMLEFWLVRLSAYSHSCCKCMYTMVLSFQANTFIASDLYYLCLWLIFHPFYDDLWAFAEGMRRKWLRAEYSMDFLVCLFLFLLLLLLLSKNWPLWVCVSHCLLKKWSFPNECYELQGCLRWLFKTDVSQPPNSQILKLCQGSAFRQLQTARSVLCKDQKYLGICIILDIALDQCQDRNPLALWSRQLEYDLGHLHNSLWNWVPVSFCHTLLPNGPCLASLTSVPMPSSSYCFCPGKSF